MGTFSEVFCVVYNKTGYIELALKTAEEAASRDRAEQSVVESLRDLATKFGSMDEIFTEEEIDKVREEFSSTEVDGTVGWLVMIGNYYLSKEEEGEFCITDSKERAVRFGHNDAQTLKTALRSIRINAELEFFI